MVLRFQKVFSKGFFSGRGFGTRSSGFLWSGRLRSLWVSCPLYTHGVPPFLRSSHLIPNDVTTCRSFQIPSHIPPRHWSHSWYSQHSSRSRSWFFFRSHLAPRVLVGYHLPPQCSQLVGVFSWVSCTVLSIRSRGAWSFGGAAPWSELPLGSPFGRSCSFSVSVTGSVSPPLCESWSSRLRFGLAPGRAMGTPLVQVPSSPW